MSTLSKQKTEAAWIEALYTSAVYNLQLLLM